MLTIKEAFRKFKSRLELNAREEQNAIERHMEVRTYVCTKFSVVDDFLTGSYKRHTKTKPLKDIDIFCVLGEKERHYRNEHPSRVLDDFRDALAEKYGSTCVSYQRRAVTVDFGVKPDADDNTDYRVVSVDVVPAFLKNDDYEIPDNKGGNWIESNPKIHAEKAVVAHQAFSKEWKGFVRMMKYWNNHNGKPIKPSFLIEVMALECLQPPFTGVFDREMKAFFATLASRIDETWEEPARLGPPVSGMMDATETATARTALLAAERSADNAIYLAKTGKNGEALDAWRALMGPRFPLS